MNREDDIVAVFKKLEGRLDIESPLSGHQQRFLTKLKSSQHTKADATKIIRWQKPLGIAASLLFLCVIGILFLQKAPTVKEQIVKIAPEVSETEFYFANLLSEQLEQLKNEDAPETQHLIQNTLTSLKSLETDYAELEKELLKGGNSKLLLKAMIINFQTRMDLLSEVLEKIEMIKTYTPYSNENSTL